MPRYQDELCGRPVNHKGIHFRQSRMEKDRLRYYQKTNKPNKRVYNVRDRCGYIIKAVEMSWTSSKKREIQRRMLFGLLKQAYGCTDCSYREDPVALDWDHIPGTTKKHNITSLLGRHDSKALWDERLKCEVVCANCHRIRTAQRKTVGAVDQKNDYFAES